MVITDSPPRDTLTVMSGYRVPGGRFRSELRVSNSRFITTIERVDTTAAAHAALRAIRAEMPDATHHVYGFRVGHGASVIEGMSDDGEPGGTSGPPTLAVLRGSGLGDVLLVTTRYFGGTRLGTGGLVAAYGEAARAALARAPTEVKVIRVRLELTFEYAALEPIRRAAREFDALMSDERFSDVVTLQAAVPDSLVDAFCDRIENLTRGACRPRPVIESTPRFDPG